MPVMEGDDLADLANRVADDRQPVYCFNVAIAARLAGIDSVGAKLRLLLTYLEAAPDDAAPLLDQLIADFLDDTGSLTDILGEHPDLFTALRCLIALARGDRWERSDAPDGLDALRRWIGAGRMPYCRDAVLRRVAQSLRGHRPLAGGDLPSEVRAQEKLMDSLRDAEGWLRGGLAMTEAFRARAGRQLHADAIAGLLAGGEGPFAHFQRLLEIEGGIIEGPSKERYAEYLTAIVDSPVNRADFTDVAMDEARERMRRLAALSDSIAASRLPDVTVEKLNGALDGFCAEVLTKSRLLTRFPSGEDDAAERAIGLIGLCAEGELTRGRALEMTRSKVLALLCAPDFMEALAGRAASSSHGHEPLIALRHLLESIEDAKLAI